MERPKLHMNATQELFSLGHLYPSDFLESGQDPRSPPVELKMIMDTASKLVKLEQTAVKSSMYGRYWYRSGINPAMKRELENIVTSTLSRMKIQTGDIWLDIACNDGTLLSYVPKNFVRIGVDPADDSFLSESQLHADLVIQDFFSKKLLEKNHIKQKVKVITCIAMFYDLENPQEFLHDIHDVLDDGGLFICQLSYTPLMIEQLAFDNICHEHVFYYTLTTLKNMFNSQGLEIIDAELNTVNGGSIRVYAVKSPQTYKSSINQQYFDVGKMRVDSLLNYEKQQQYNSPEKWQSFYKQIQILKKQTCEFVKEQVAQGKTIWAYGASTKGNTLLQYFGLDNTLINGIAERSEFKYGLRTVGTNIPIYNEQYMRQSQPDFLLVLPWHFIDVFVEREHNWLEQGGKFIVPCPKFEIIGLK
jgi:NDP-4-keto-2,6-dideoxyhexose 3-C-methyltransferase